MIQGLPFGAEDLDQRWAKNPNKRGQNTITEYSKGHAVHIQAPSFCKITFAYGSGDECNKSYHKSYIDRDRKEDDRVGKPQASKN